MVRVRREIVSFGVEGPIECELRPVTPRSHSQFLSSFYLRSDNEGVERQRIPGDLHQYRKDTEVEGDPLKR